MSPRKRIGVLIPSTNTTCEADFQMTVPRDVTIHGRRPWLSTDTPCPKWNTPRLRPAAR